MKTVFIYTLNCPVTGEVRYVGKSVNPDERYVAHLLSKEKNHKANWIRSVLATGEKPKLEILDEVFVPEWQALEAAYIQFFREEGCLLVNATSGGEGVEMTPEIRAKMCEAQKGNTNSLGKPKSEEHRAKLRKPRSEESKANMRKPRSEEAKANMRKPKSAEHRKNLSASKSGEKHPNFGKNHSLGTLANMRAAWALRKEKANATNA